MTFHESVFTSKLCENKVNRYQNESPFNQCSTSLLIPRDLLPTTLTNYDYYLLPITYYLILIT